MTGETDDPKTWANSKNTVRKAYYRVRFEGWSLQEARDGRREQK